MDLRVGAKRVWPVLASVLVAVGSAPAWGKEPLETVVAFRSRPAVVLIGVQVGATAQVHCGRRDPVAARPTPFSWIGSGSIIHPDGWVVTNGHVVRPVAEQNDGEYLPKLLEAAVAEACRPLLDGLAGEARAARIRALASDPANRSGITIEKKVQVIMGNGKRFPAEIKTYSPPRLRPGGHHARCQRRRAEGIREGRGHPEVRGE